jgi:hypothetical protein
MDSSDNPNVGGGEGKDEGEDADTKAVSSILSAYGEVTGRAARKGA